MYLLALTLANCLRVVLVMMTIVFNQQDLLSSRRMDPLHLRNATHLGDIRVTLYLLVSNRSRGLRTLIYAEFALLERCVVASWSRVRVSHRCRESGDATVTTASNQAISGINRRREHEHQTDNGEGDQHRLHDQTIHGFDTFHKLYS